MYYVLGSGPAAVSAAHALVQRGRKVTIIDPGNSLEEDRQRVLDRLAGQEPGEWSLNDLQFLRTDHSSSHGKIHSKLSYGSDYPYADVDEPLLEGHDQTPFHYSMAKGGLSTVWGVSSAPYAAKDIADWPIGMAALEEHYRAVLEFMPSTGEDDALADLLPKYSERLQPIRRSSQAEALLASMNRNGKKLRKCGIHFGAARHALWLSGDDQRHACAYCGLCLYGCPYSLLYSSAHTLEGLIASGQVDYISGHYVERLEQQGEGVTIHARNVAKADSVTFEAERVFVGCGILPTAYIMLNSRDAYDTPVEIIDSQYFIYPFFRFKRARGIESEKLHGAAQMFIELDDPSVSKHLVHMEVFGYSEFIKNAMMATPLRFLLKSPWISAQLFERLFVLQCFLHSDDSSRLSLTLKRAGDGSRARLHMQPNRRWRSLGGSIRAGLKLARHALSLGGMPVVPALQFAGPGRSYHSGGTFPMKAEPRGLETDILGRMPDMDRVHLVDASVFPTVPATTITLSVMANAHRIATEAAGL
ncbi:MAG: hypothetical protein KJ626_15960 [Verrucomicrobia bacterium]|nr:hypothetical protein [Verrucomicrobiota bacterium]